MSSSKRVSKINSRLVSPFGPSIMVGYMPDGIYKDFKTIIERVLKEKRRTHTTQLAGRIEEEWTIGEDEIWQTQTEEFLNAVSVQYGKQLINRIFGEGIEWDAQQKTPQNVVVESKCVGGWVNEMKSGEYNPVHYHPFCNLTSVFYFNNIDKKFLKEMIAPANENMSGTKVEPGTSGDGMLELIYKSGINFEQGTFRVTPEEKMFLIFPSFLLHTVYPFISDKKRISASFNFQLSSNSEIINFGVK